MLEVVVTAGAIRCAELQSNGHQQQTSAQLFIGRMHLLSLNQECQSTNTAQFQTVMLKQNSSQLLPTEIHSLALGFYIQFNAQVQRE